MSESRVRENRTHGSMRRREATSDQSATPRGPSKPPADPTGCRVDLSARTCSTRAETGRVPSVRSTLAFGAAAWLASGEIVG